jgi:TetR/AcrR family transcriptional regulator, repressor of fatR-cypB operon
MGKREDILSATLLLISEEGLQSVTFSKIFQKANVGSGTFYNYFANKEKLINELYKEIGAHMGSEVIRNYDRNLALYERFKCMLQNITDFALHYPKELTFFENYVHSPYISEEVRNKTSLAMEEFFAIFEEGQKQGILREMDKMLSCHIVFGVILSVIKGYLAGKYTLEEYQIQQTIEACWKAVRL